MDIEQFPLISTKVSTKHIFKDVEVKMPGDQWKIDRKLLAVSNPNYERIERE